jgi:hypothetical protein
MLFAIFSKNENLYFMILFLNEDFEFSSLFLYLFLFLNFEEPGKRFFFVDDILVSPHKQLIEWAVAFLSSSSFFNTNHQALKLKCVRSHHVPNSDSTAAYCSMNVRSI